MLRISLPRCGCLRTRAVVTDRAVTAAKLSTQLSTLRYKRGLVPYLEVLTNQTIELADERSAASLVARRMVGKRAVADGARGWVEGGRASGELAGSSAANIRAAETCCRLGRGSTACGGNSDIPHTFS